MLQRLSSLLEALLLFFLFNLGCSRCWSDHIFIYFLNDFLLFLLVVRICDCVKSHRYWINYCRIELLLKLYFVVRLQIDEICQHLLVLL